MRVRRLRVALLLCCVAGGARAQAADPRAAPEPPAALTLRLDPRLSESAAAESEGRPVYGRGDRMYGRTDRETTLEGNAEIRRQGTVVRADRLTYYPDDDELVAVGNVRVVRQGNVFVGTELQLKLDANEGFFENPIYYLPRYHGQGRAERLDFLGADRLSFTNATYTTCRPDDPDWFLRTERLTVDENKQEGTGRWANLIFKGHRILTAPLFAFPLGDERRTGFLAPTLSLTTKTGAEVLTPFYWNLAPNRDLTLYPRFMATRGIQLGGDFRYLDRNYYGEALAEFTPHDTLTNSSRHYWNLQHTSLDFFGWSASATLKGVSDDNYFVDYSRSILSSSERSLPRDVVLSRSYGYWTLLGRVTRYQNILDARAAPPYERLPQLSANYLKLDVDGFDMSTLLDATSFSRPLIVSPEGQRYVANPTLSYPILHPGWFSIPKVGVHLSAYRLGENLGAPTSINRVVPTFSIDNGVVFERDTTIFGKALTQTLEPRIFYVRTPYRDQSNIPVFDTAPADFNFAQLFSENTFVGHDRIADVNQLTTAFVSRLIDPATGGENLRLAIGQRRYFSDQLVQIPGVAPRTDRRSDLLLAAAGDLGGGRSFDGGIQYSVNDGTVPRASLAWRFAPNDGRVFNAGVRYQRDQIGQVDTSWRWPVLRRWTALGRINYSWLDKRIDDITGSLVDTKPGIIEGILGVEYTADCWVARVVAQRFVTATNTTTTALFIQLELTGLARIGSDPFDILRRSIPGYRLPNERPPAPSRFFGYE